MQAPFPSPNWQPAPARTIAIPTPTNLRARSLIATTMQVSWAPKSSADALDFVLDPTNWLDQTNDAIARVFMPSVPTATGLPTDLTPLWWGPIGGMAVVFLGGGAPGTVQMVNVTIQSQQGRLHTQQIQIAITLATNATTPPSVPTTAAGIGIPPNAMSRDGVSVLSIDGIAPLVIA